MSTEKRKKVTIKHLLNKKANGEMIVSLGVYDAPMAAIADEIGFDLLINGNAGPMSLLGHPTPLTVRYEEPLILTQAVSRMTMHAMVVGHMPYMTYHISAHEAVRKDTEAGSEGTYCGSTCKSRWSPDQ